VVRGYRVRYAAVNDVTGMALEDSWKVVELENSSASRVVLAGLQSDQLYVVEMNAFTRRTDGQRTRQLRVNTHPAGTCTTTSTVLDRWRRV